MRIYHGHCTDANKYLSFAGFCTYMKTVEITCHNQAASGVKPPSICPVFGDIWRREGLARIDKDVNAVALRQIVNRGSRYAIYLSPKSFQNRCQITEWDLHDFPSPSEPWRAKWD